MYCCKIHFVLQFVHLCKYFVFEPHVKRRNCFDVYQTSSYSKSWNVDVFVEFSVFFRVTAGRWRAGSEGLRESGGKDQWELAWWKEASRDPQSWVIHHQMNKPHTHTATRKLTRTHRCARTDRPRLRLGDVRTHHCQSFISVLWKERTSLNWRRITVCFSVSFTVIGWSVCCVSSSTCVRAKT